MYEACSVAARPVDPYAVERILAYETLSETEWVLNSGAGFQPTVYTDIRRTSASSMRLLVSFKVKSGPHPRSADVIQSLATYRGAAASQGREAFALVRELSANSLAGPR